jgi:hypothetical protein
MVTVPCSLLESLVANVVANVATVTALLAGDKNECNLRQFDSFSPRTDMPSSTTQRNKRRRAARNKRRQDPAATQANMRSPRPSIKIVKQLGTPRDDPPTAVDSPVPFSPLHENTESASGNLLGHNLSEDSFVTDGNPNETTLASMDEPQDSPSPSREEERWTRHAPTGRSLPSTLLS